MAVRLKQVAQYENLQLDDNAAVLIARIADGALRDGLSILDQCAGRSNIIDSAVVSEAVGMAGREALYNLSSSIANKDCSNAINIISNLYQNSFDMERLCVEMINHFRNLLIVKTVKKNRELIICTDDEYNTIVSTAEKFTLENIIFALDLFQNTLVTIKGGASARIEVEMALVKLCEPKLEQSMDSVLDRLSALERAVKNGVVTAPAPTPVSAQKVEAPVNNIVEEKPIQTVQKPIVPEQKEEFAPQPSPAPPIENPQPQIQEPAPVQAEAVQSDVQTEFTQWGEFMDALHRTDIALFGVLSGSRGYVRGEFFLIDSQNPTVNEFIKIKTHSRAIKKALYDVTGKQFKLGIFKRKETDATAKRDPLEDLITMASPNINIDLK
jgi:DNA polymerase-3 subunit gamma/tau